MTVHRVSLRWVTALVAGAGLALAGCAAPTPGGAAGPLTTSTGFSTNTGSSTNTGAETGRATGTSAGGSTVPPFVDCAKGALPTVQPGTITIGTDSPATGPWFAAGTPSNGDGLESSVGYALAGVLGYGRDQVSWITIDRQQAAAGDATGFDIDLNQFTAPDGGTAAVDYSTGYFAVTDTLVTNRSSASQPATAAALKGQRLGAVAGSTGVATATRVTGSDPISYPDQGQALAALSAGTLPAVVLPTPAAIAAAQADPSLLLVGQLPTDPSVQPTQFKVLLAKGSALTGCVSGAVDRLRVEGTLEQLAAQWVDPLVPQLR